MMKIETRSSHGLKAEMTDGVTATNNDYEQRIREIAELLYNVSHDIHDHSVRAIWEDDSWAKTDSVIQNGIRGTFYDKALKMCAHYETNAEIKHMVRFLNEVNPKTLRQLIEEL